MLMLACGGFAACEVVRHDIHLRSGKTLHLSSPPGYEIRVLAEGLKRVRFFAIAPDGRIFVTGLYNRADNRRGTVYILDGFDAEAGTIHGITTYLSGLRNP